MSAVVAFRPSRGTGEITLLGRTGSVHTLSGRAIACIWRPQSTRCEKQGSAGARSELGLQKISARSKAGLGSFSCPNFEASMLLESKGVPPGLTAQPTLSVARTVDSKMISEKKSEGIARPIDSMTVEGVGGNGFKLLVTQGVLSESFDTCGNTLWISVNLGEVEREPGVFDNMAEPGSGGSFCKFCGWRIWARI